MSRWVRIYGTICVRPMGRTQAEKSYILQTVLDHLPCVSGSESDMKIYTQLKEGHNSSSSHDEFGRLSNLLINRYDKHSINGWLQVQDEYLLIIDADLRDRYYKETIRDFQKWLCRLSKRIMVENILVNICGYFPEENFLISNNSPYTLMYEPPTWSRINFDGEPNWCEYLMWQAMDENNLPRILGYKYYNDATNDKKVQEWIKR